MSRLLEVRRLRRAMLLLSLALGLWLAAAPWPATAERSDHGNVRAGAEDPDQRPAPVQEHAPGQQAAQAREQDPDERAARAEVPETGDDTVGDATLLLTPSTVLTTPGTRFRLTLSILGAEDLRRLPVTLRFDPAVVEVVSVSLGSAWDDREQPILLYDASRPGELVVGLGQLDRDKTGLFGAAELLELELLAVAAGSAEIVLERFAAIGSGSKPHRTVALTARILVR